ncbi:MAG: hypothetical protein H8E13_20820 [Actinobacteria bacterium]|nr:hypothetical protein [Actinomycetota bacterium]
MGILDDIYKATTKGNYKDIPDLIMKAVDENIVAHDIVNKALSPAMIEGTGNISLESQFNNSATFDFTLKESSPCILPVKMGYLVKIYLVEDSSNNYSIENTNIYSTSNIQDTQNIQNTQNQETPSAGDENLEYSLITTYEEFFETCTNTSTETTTTD